MNNNKIIIMGSSKKFTQSLQLLSDRKSSIEIYDLNNCAVLIGEEIKFYSQNQEIEIQKPNSVYTRIHKKNQLFTVILYTYLEYFQIKTLDLSNNIGAGFHSKPAQMMRLAVRGIGIPKSLFVNNITSFRSNQRVFENNFTFPVVIKSNGDRGEAVWLIENMEDLIIKFQKIGQNILIQEYIPNDFDIRVLVLDNQVVGAMKRSSGDDFYNNISKGSKSEMISLSEDEINIALEATQSSGLDLSGVDIVRQSGKSLVFEVNNTPSYEGFEKASGINVTELIIKLLNNK